MSVGKRERRVKGKAEVGPAQKTPGRSAVAVDSITPIQRGRRKMVMDKWTVG